MLKDREVVAFTNVREWLSPWGACSAVVLGGVDCDFNFVASENSDSAEVEAKSFDDVLDDA